MMTAKAMSDSAMKKIRSTTSIGRIQESRNHGESDEEKVADILSSTV